jgi:hypothetical protein
MSLLKCLTKKIGTKYSSPREFFGYKRKPQEFVIKEVSEEKQRVVLQFESGTNIPLGYWRFNHVINLLVKKKGEFVRIGSKIDPEKESSIESSLYWHAIENELSAARLRTAPFVCDLLVLCGYAEYGYKEGKRGRSVQAIKATEKLLPH